MLDFLQQRLPELWLRTGEHIVLTGIATAIAIAIGVPLGILAARSKSLRGLITGTVSILQTIPSLAMLAFLLAMLNKIGFTPAVIALTLYALLPIVRNTLAGLEGVPAPIREAADGVGMTARQRLWMVELPLALPVIVTGIRTAAVVGVGIATLSAFIGAGGLGQFINRGLSLSNNHLILLGAIPSALLALLVDAAIGAAHWAATRRAKKSLLKPIALSFPLILFALGVIATTAPNPFAPKDTTPANAAVIRIGSKNFTEQLILGELMAQLIERETDLRVERRFDLGGTMICHGALIAGELDLYAEYTGTGLTAILKEKVRSDPDEVYQLVTNAYAQQFQLQWLQPFGFNNTYAITVRATAAKTNNWNTISDLKSAAAKLRAGWTFEFSERPDGYPGLREHYGFSFGKVRDLESALMYQAIALDEVDVICAFATDGRIAANGLRPLKDDQQFFPPYHAAPVIRQSTLERHPELKGILDQLAGQLTDVVMQQLNLEVDQNKKSPADVATEFLGSLEQ
jgi:osmoprotectant transport system permease protein